MTPFFNDKFTLDKTSGLITINSAGWPVKEEPT